MYKLLFLYYFYSKYIDYVSPLFQVMKKFINARERTSYKVCYLLYMPAPQVHLTDYLLNGTYRVNKY